jgi:hypothetical protein
MGVSTTSWLGGLSARMSAVTDSLHIDHSEKIEFMIETDGSRLRQRLGSRNSIPPVGVTSYTIGLPAHVGFADVVVFGLTPVAAHGLIGMVAEVLHGGTEIPLRVELVGLLDNELRNCYAPVDLEECGGLFATAAAWYPSEAFEMVQLLYPDCNGFLP